MHSRYPCSVYIQGLSAPSTALHCKLIAWRGLGLSAPGEHFKCADPAQTLLPVWCPLQAAPLKVKVKVVYIGLAVNGTPSYSYGVLLAICMGWSHSVTCHPRQVNSPRLNPAKQAGTRLTYPGGMEGWVDLFVIHTADGHPSMQTGPIVN